MCTLCYQPTARPRVIDPCSACKGLGMTATANPCAVCHGRAYTSHEVSFDCQCDGCKEFRGEAHALPVPVTSANFYLLPEVAA